MLGARVFTALVAPTRSITAASVFPRVFAVSPLIRSRIRSKSNATNPSSTVSAVRHTHTRPCTLLTMSRLVYLRDQPYVLSYTHTHTQRPFVYTSRGPLRTVIRREFANSKVNRSDRPSRRLMGRHAVVRALVDGGSKVRETVATKVSYGTIDTYCRSVRPILYNPIPRTRSLS